MKICRVGIVMLLVMGMFSVAIATWSDDFCDMDKSCKDLSKNFTQPYCEKENNKNSCTRSALANNLSSYRSNNKNIGEMELGDIIQNYCSSLLGDASLGRVYYSKPSGENPDTWDWQQTFDSHQSIFVYALCSSFQDNDGNTPFIQNDNLVGIFKDKDIVNILKLKQRLEGKDKCSLQDYPSLQDCDMSIYATEIYSTIMSDVFKIKYAQVLNVDKSENFDKKIESFMLGYFGYTKGDGFESMFPQTVNLLKTNQKYYKQVLDSVKLINNSNLVDIAQNQGCSTNKNKEGIDFIACALHSSQGKGSALTPAFVTMIYNEMLHYSIFDKYLQYRVDAKTKYMVNNGGGNSQIEKYKSKAVDFQWYANLQLQATKESLHTFEDFNMTYPLHIGLLMYQEKIKEFRDKNLSPIVTIFYSLSEKLQNVQLPN